MIHASKLKLNRFCTILGRDERNPQGIATAPTATVDVVLRFTYELLDEEDVRIVESLGLVVNDLKSKDLESKQLG